MKKTFDNKKLLILGGNPETGELVKTANQLGITTLVVDPNPDSPAKKFAHKSYDVDGMDIDSIVKIANIEQVDGVLVGVADILVPTYVEVCEQLDLPCYATHKIIDAFSSKDGFINICKEYGVPTTPSYAVQGGLNHNDIQFPVMVKPVDNGGGVGMSICHSVEELKEGIQVALQNSKKQRYVVERYMECEDAAAYYTFVDGDIYLSAMFDRYTSKKQGKFSPVCIATEYPSKHVELYLQDVHPKVVKLFQGLEIMNGVLCLQFFVKEKRMYAYDPGFRLQGEAPHLYLEHFNDFDHRKLLINFAMTGRFFEGDFSKKNDFQLDGNYASTLLILLSHGKICQINGLEAIRKHKNVIWIMQRFEEGDHVGVEMVGTERQIFARIYIVGNSRKAVIETTEFIHKQLEIFDDSSCSMIVDRFYPE